MTNKILFIIIGVAVLFGLLTVILPLVTPKAEAPGDETQNNDDVAMCTADAMQCPDGTFVGRSGVNCEFVCPTLQVPADVQAQIDAHADVIRVTLPAPMTEISSPVTLVGQARGYWFFEASAPVTLVDWDGKIIAEGFVTADGDWMTEDFVPFGGELTFISPYTMDQEMFMKRGTLIFSKDNPSGLPENDDAVEIPIYFTANAQ